MGSSASYTPFPQRYEMKTRGHTAENSGIFTYKLSHFTILQKVQYDNGINYTDEAEGVAELRLNTKARE